MFYLSYFFNYSIRIAVNVLKIIKAAPYERIIPLYVIGTVSNIIQLKVFIFKNIRRKASVQNWSILGRRHEDVRENP